jgi:hypothetical protein
LVFWLHLLELVGHKNAKLNTKAKTLYVLIENLYLIFKLGSQIKVRISLLEAVEALRVVRGQGSHIS